MIMKKVAVKTGIKNPRFVILTVVSMNENSFGLQDHNFPFECKDLSITLTNERIEMNNSIVAYNQNGRLTNPEINKWIQENKLHEVGKPTKLIFRLEKIINKYHYKLYKYQGNYIADVLNNLL